MCPSPYYVFFLVFILFSVFKKNRCKKSLKKIDNQFFVLWFCVGGTLGGALGWATTYTQ